MDTRLILLFAVVAAIVFRRPLLALAAKIFTPAVLVTFALFVLLAVAGVAFWYWWHLEPTPFYQNSSTDETIEDNTSTSSRPHLPPRVELR